MSEKASAAIHSPFVAIVITTNDAAITGLQLHRLDSTRALLPPKDSVAELACQRLDAYFNNSRFIFDLPLKIIGAEHQIKVWQAMRLIAPGSASSYGELAKQINSSPRAVGQTCGQNPIPIIIPCHRIVAANGTIGGFMRGQTDHTLTIKRWLLRYEGRQYDK